MLGADGGGGGGMLNADGGGGGGMLNADGGGGGGMLNADGGGGGSNLAAAMAGGTVDGGTRRVGFMEREASSIGSCCGAFFCGIPLLLMLTFWNEYNLVISEATADLVNKARVVPDCVPDGAENSRLIFTSCAVQAPELAGQLPDAIKPFYPSFEGASLSWNVEIYQYEEHSHESCEKNNDGSKTCHTTYSYDAGWRGSAVNSNSFHSSSYSNGRTDLPSNINNGEVSAPAYSVIMHSATRLDGPAYALPTDIANQLPSKSVHAQAPQQALQQGAGWQGSGYLASSALHADGSYVSTANGSPRIGDIRVSLSGQMADTASVAAQQVRFANAPGFSLKQYPPQKFDFWGRKTYPLARLEAGMESKNDFIKHYHSENSMFANLLRLCGLVGMIIMCCMILSPLSVAADMLRIINCITCGLGTLLDNAAQAVIGMVSCGLGCSLWMFAVAVSWFFVHPTMSICIMVVGVCTAVVLPRVAGSAMGKKAGAREQDGYMKMGGVAFNVKKVQPEPYLV